MEIFIDLILPAALLLMGGLNLQQNWIAGAPAGGKGTGLTTLPPSCTCCLEILGTSNSYSPKDFLVTLIFLKTLFWNVCISLIRDYSTAPGSIGMYQYGMWERLIRDYSTAPGSIGMYQYGMWERLIQN
jgi:hypothetical protein